MFALPGGSPGRNAQASWLGLIFLFLLAAGAGIAFLFVWKYAVEMNDKPPSQPPVSYRAPLD